jgi:predicted RNase H-like nuclease (RuvC/YqgF family)
MADVSDDTPTAGDDIIDLEGQWHGRQELADRLGVSTRTIDRRVKRGQIEKRETPQGKLYRPTHDDRGDDTPTHGDDTPTDSDDTVSSPATDTRLAELEARLEEKTARIERLEERGARLREERDRARGGRETAQAEVESLQATIDRLEDEREETRTLLEVGPIRVEWLW